MPTKEGILNGLQTIVNNYPYFAIAWHAFLYLLLAAIVFIWRPSNRVFALVISLPVLSVALFAWLTNNPFNGLLFTILAILIFIFGLKASNDPLSVSQIPFAVMGVLMIAFGLVYPHFFNPSSFLAYFYASPVGLIPCPTLSVVIGFLLLYNGLGSNTLTLTLIVFGLFYGIFGVLKLAVYLDIFLVFGTISLLIKYFLLLRA